MMQEKPKLSSAVTGNPYGRTGAPGHAAEADLVEAPPPKPQMPNLNALRIRGMAGARPPMGPPPLQGGAPQMPSQPPMGRPLQPQGAPPTQFQPNPAMAPIYQRYGVR
jgi:hypothetical protein